MIINSEEQIVTLIRNAKQHIDIDKSTAVYILLKINSGIKNFWFNNIVDENIVFDIGFIDKSGDVGYAKVSKKDMTEENKDILFSSWLSNLCYEQFNTL